MLEYIFVNQSWQLALHIGSLILSGSSLISILLFFTIIMPERLTSLHAT